MITILGAILAWHLNDKQVWIESIMYATILLGVKTVSAATVEAKKGAEQ
jgi:hypothetical protein